MRVIHKFKLSLEKSQVILAPARWKPLALQLQEGVPTLWVVVYPELEDVEYTIECIGTGHYIDIRTIDYEKYLGTVQCDIYVWHFFEKYEAN